VDVTDLRVGRLALSSPKLFNEYMETALSRAAALFLLELNK